MAPPVTKRKLGQVNSGVTISSAGREHEHERHQHLAEAQPEGGVAGLERIGAGHAGGGVGGERHGRRDVGQHAVIEDEEVRDDRLRRRAAPSVGAATVTMMM